MIRFVLASLASVLLHATNPEWADFGSKIGLSSNLLHWYLKWTVSVWALLELHWAANRLTDRRWMWTTDKSVWDWKREIAVVTGGSSGIGACTAKKLASHGIRVAVLDVSPLSDVFTQGQSQHASNVPC